jgi:glutamine synthetase
VLVMCDVLMPDQKTPHQSNSRASIPDDADTWFGFEQEYFFFKDGAPLGFPSGGFPAAAGPVLHRRRLQERRLVAREIVEKHIDVCLDAGINIEGINAEVAKGQWEFQIFGKGSKNAADQMWVARYILSRLCEKYGIDIEWRCKPILGPSTPRSTGTAPACTRTSRRSSCAKTGGKAYFEKLMAAFAKHMDEHIAVYGPENHLRLTGLHETQSIDKFTYGIADRGSSIRVPHSFINAGYKGYLEDRRPNSAADPVPGRRSDPEDHPDGAHDLIGPTPG